MSDRDLSNAYLRLRAMIPGAYDTPNAPTPEQVWETTEAALRRLLQEHDDAREEGVRILAEAAADYPDDPDYVAAQRLAPCSRVPDTYTHERIAAAIVAARHEERERCAQHIEALACQLRDHGPTSPEGLLTALAGAQVGALLDAAASLREDTP